MGVGAALGGWLSISVGGGECTCGACARASLRACSSERIFVVGMQIVAVIAVGTIIGQMQQVRTHTRTHIHEKVIEGP